MKKSYVYFLTNRSKSTIYVGVTSNLVRRIHQHKLKIYKGFTAKYNCDRLVYFEEYNTISEAIAREKILKSGNRKRKEFLINNFNPEWNDLSKDWIFDTTWFRLPRRVELSSQWPFIFRHCEPAEAISFIAISIWRIAVNGQRLTK